MKPKTALAGAVFTASLLLGRTAGHARELTQNEANTIAVEAYFYPLVTMDLTRRQVTSLDPATNAFGGVRI
jgi:transcriptional regulator of met regulon